MLAVELGHHATADRPPRAVVPAIDSICLSWGFTMLELAEQVLELTGSRSKIVFRELPYDDPRQRQPGITLAQEELGWEPKVPLAEGLARTIDYFRSSLD